MTQPDLFGGDEARQRLAIERKAAAREGPAYRAGRTRRGDRDTSMAAEGRVERRAKTIKKQVEAVFRAADKYGMTDDELKCRFPNAPESSYRKRRTELAQAGILYDSGERKTNRRGDKEIVWVHCDYAGPRAKKVEPVPGRVARLRAAVEKAAATFRHYEQLHRAKGPDGHAKADANAALAAEMEGALK